jgi:hypothetical protein
MSFNLINYIIEGVYYRAIGSVNIVASRFVGTKNK